MKLEDIEMQTKSVAMVGVIEGGHLVTSDSIKTVCNGQKDLLNHRYVSLNFLLQSQKILLLGCKISQMY